MVCVWRLMCTPNILAPTGMRASRVMHGEIVNNAQTTKGILPGNGQQTGKNHWSLLHEYSVRFVTVPLLVETASPIAPNRQRKRKRPKEPVVDGPCHQIRTARSNSMLVHSMLRCGVQRRLHVSRSQRRSFCNPLLPNVFRGYLQLRFPNRPFSVNENPSQVWRGPMSCTFLGGHSRGIERGASSCAGRVDQGQKSQASILLGPL
jgi:hypothetical protein